MKYLKWIKLKHRVYLTLGICLTAVSFSCFAYGETVEEPIVQSDSLNIEEDFSEIDIDGQLSDDELASRYINQVMPSRRRTFRVPRLQGASLQGANRNMYQLLRADIQKIANGTMTSTQISYSMEDIYSQLTFTAEDLGVENLDFSEETKQAVKDRLDSDMQIQTVMRALLADCPYELYWFDKTSGYSQGTSYGLSISGQTLTVSSGTLTMKMRVSINYAQAIDNGDGSYSINPYEVDPKYGQGVQAAARNAQAIVSQYENLDNYDRLLAYKTSICSLASYNDAAADDNNNTPYGDPWQLIWVFDGDETTTVVCEGYSKAFKYLNDLSGGSAEVICAEGTMDGGPHMWNIVRMEDGRNYLVDITNTDSGTIGEPDYLFLAGTQNGSVDEGYVFAAAGENTVTYVYGDSLGFSAEDLTIAPEGYLAFHDHEQESSLIADPQIITGLWYSGNDFNITVEPDQNTVRYKLWLSQGDQVLYDWSTASGEELQGNQTVHIDASEIQADACITVRTIQYEADRSAKETTLSIWPIDHNAILKLPEDLTSIEQESFLGAADVRHVIISDDVRSIGEGAFADSGIRTIEIPASVTGFQGNIFGKSELTIYGYAGSEAETYAKNLGLSFVRIQ